MEGLKGSKLGVGFFIILSNTVWVRRVVRLLEGME